MASRKHHVPPRPSSASGLIVRRPGLLAALVIIAAALGAYHNSFNGPFFFDSVSSIVENPTIRSFSTALFPPINSGATVSGRPLVNLSFALNYAFGGVNVRGYHIVNLALHILVGLVLFGVVRRTLARGQRIADNTPVLIALAVAVLWIVHPLGTESVTYVVQRAESLVALFYLLTLYTVVRGAGSTYPTRWYSVAVLTCLGGMASKEVMITAPLVVFLYDRTFLAPSIREVWRQRGKLYLGLATTWLLLAVLIVVTGSRGGTAGFGTEANWRYYAFTQCRAVLLYFKLAVWPNPLVVDYGDGVETSISAVWPYALVLTGLLAGTVIALRSDRWRWLGFLGGCYFVILAPTSSVVPVATQTIAEHRVYLPLAAIVTAAVIGLNHWIGRRFIFVAAGLALALGSLTIQRNRDYRSLLAIWSDTATKCPQNSRAQVALGDALQKAGRPGDAIQPYEEAIRLKPERPDAYNNLGTALADTGNAPEALRRYEQALQLDPDFPEANNNLGTMLYSAGRMQEAIPLYQRALRKKPDYPEAQYNLGLALADTGHLAEAIATFRATVKDHPELVPAWCSLGKVLEKTGQISEAVASFEEALRRAPDSVEAREGLARLPANR